MYGQIQLKFFGEQLMVTGTVKRIVVKYKDI